MHRPELNSALDIPKPCGQGAAMNCAFQTPPRLCAGDRVAVAAPSSPFDREAFDRGLSVLAARYRVSIDDGIYDAERFFAGPDSERLRILQEALDDDSIRAIFCARGGYGAMRLLPGIRWPSAPKVLVGFSDITALHLACQQHGWKSLHGPVVTQLGRLDGSTAEALFDALENPHGRIVLRGERGTDGRAAGPVIGGNLSVLTRLLGTPFLPNLRGAILFIEDVGERPYRLDRMMAHLELCGVLDAVSGVALGALTDCDDQRFRGEDVVMDFVRAHALPCVKSLPVGHGLENMPVPLGCRAQLDGAAGTLTFEESGVSG